MMNRRRALMRSTTVHVALALTVTSQRAGQPPRLFTIPVLHLTGLVALALFILDAPGRLVDDLAMLVNDLQSSLAFTRNVFIIGFKSLSYGVVGI